MRQVFHNYTLWEDFKNKMYDEDKDGRSERVEQAISLLSDLELLYEQMRRVTHEWPYATEQNLTNSSINHQAFLGQAACCIYAGVHEDETREAWGYLTNEQRHAANLVADRVDLEWAREYEAIHSNYQFGLFDEEGEV